eukprot:SAG11_NODE_12681_length_691_cov_0.564189_1_plen_58_part_01
MTSNGTAAANLDLQGFLARYDIWHWTGNYAPRCFRQLTTWQIPENWPKTRTKSSQGPK